MSKTFERGFINDFGRRAKHPSKWIPRCPTLGYLLEAPLRRSLRPPEGIVTGGYHAVLG